jgi:hypothetical protein
MMSAAAEQIVAARFIHSLRIRPVKLDAMS